MNQEQWDELKRLHAKLPCERLTFGTEQICELNASGGYSPIAERVSAREVDQFMAYMQFFTTFHNAFPQILAEREAAQVENERLRQGLRYYARGNHFVRVKPEAWETVSGEPDNFFEDEAGTATVEDGSMAAHALRNNIEWDAAESVPIEGEKPSVPFDKESKND